MAGDAYTIADMAICSWYGVLMLPDSMTQRFCRCMNMLNVIRPTKLPNA
jgi:hypothetical protein